MQNWLGTCGDDLVIGSSNVPCIENMVLVGALCLPIFLVVQFDTGLLYQVVVFAYGCTNGLVVLGLGQVVTWNDLVKQFERGAIHLHSQTSAVLCYFAVVCVMCAFKGGQSMFSDHPVSGI